MEAVDEAATVQWAFNRHLLPAAAEAVDAAAVRRAVNRHLLPPLFCVALLCQIDRSNLAFAALQMDSDLGFSRTVHGLGSGMFFIGYLAQIPANLICVAIGPRRWLPTILCCWGCVAMCFAAVRSEASFLALRLLLGVAEAGAYPAIMYCLSLFYEPRTLGVAYTWVATATAVAGLLGAPLAAALTALDGVAGLRGWQWLFLVEGVPPLLLAAALPLLLPASPLAARFLSPKEQQWLWREVHGQSRGDVEMAEVVQVAAAEPEGPSALLADSRSTCGTSAATCGGCHMGDGVGEDSPLAAGRNSGNGSAEEHAALLQHSAHAVVAAAEGEMDGEGREHTALLPLQRPAPPIPPSSTAALPDQQPGEQPQPLGATGSRGMSRATLAAGLLDARVWHLAGAMLLIDVVMNSCNFWLPSLVKAALQGQLKSDSVGSSGGSPSVAATSTTTTTSSVIKASLLSALPFCGAAACMVANALHARGSNERRLHTAVPLLASSAALAALPALSGLGPEAALVALTVASSGIWATHGPFFSWPSAFLDHRAGAMGFALMKTGGAAGGFCGPLLVGALADALHGYGGAMLLLAGVAAAAAGTVYVFDDRLREQPAG